MNILDSLVRTIEKNRRKEKEAEITYYWKTSMNNLSYRFVKEKRKREYESASRKANRQMVILNPIHC
jgi:hypothetical protein